MQRSDYFSQAGFLLLRCPAWRKRMIWCQSVRRWHLGLKG